MPTIDWDRIYGQSTRDADPEPTEFSDEEIQAALDVVEAYEDEEVPTFWPVAKFGIDDLDFGDEEVTDVDIAGLCACTPTLSKQKLLWHVANPGVSKKPGPFTQHPIVLQSKKKQTIVDGEHRLAALMLLGATSWPVYLVPK